MTLLAPRRTLTAKQERFAQAVALGSTYIGALLTAYPKSEFWTRNAAGVRASRIANAPRVAARIAELRAPALELVAEKIRGEVPWIIDQAASIVERHAEGNPAPAVAALALLAKRHPEFRDQTIDARSVTIQLPEGTSLDDIRKLRRELSE